MAASPGMAQKRRLSDAQDSLAETSAAGLLSPSKKARKDDGHTDEAARFDVLETAQLPSLPGDAAAAVQAATSTLQGDLWDVKFHAMTVIRQAAKHHAALAGTVALAVIPPILEETGNLRSAVSRQSLACLSELFTTALPGLVQQSSGVTTQAEQVTASCVEPLVSRAASEKKFLKDAAVLALTALVRAAPGGAVLRALLSHADSRHIAVASASAAGTRHCLAAWRRRDPVQFKQVFTPSTPSNSHAPEAGEMATLPSAVLTGLANFLGSRSVDAKSSAKACTKVITGSVGHLPLKRLCDDLVASGVLSASQRSFLAPLLAPPRASAAGGPRTPLTARKPWLASARKAAVSTPTVLVQVATADAVDVTIAKLPAAPPCTPATAVEPVVRPTPAGPRTPPAPPSDSQSNGASSPPRTPRELRSLDVNAVLPLATPAKGAFEGRRVTRSAFAQVGKGTA